MTWLAERLIAEERMDAPDLPAETYEAVLRDLDRVNTWTLAARPTLAFLNRLVGRGERLRILDVGFGSGDMLRCIARWARRREVETELVGIDLNRRSEPIARAATPPGMNIAYKTGDYADLAGAGWDVVISSLVAHHMNRHELVRFLAFMEREARKGWLVNDLMRHRFAYLGFPVLARLMRVHPIVRHDGAVSVARSFRPREWQPLLKQAGVEGARVYRAFPFRLCVDKCR